MGLCLFLFVLSDLLLLRTSGLVVFWSHASPIPQSSAFLYWNSEKFHTRSFWYWLMQCHSVFLSINVFHHSWFYYKWFWDISPFINVMARIILTSSSMTTILLLLSLLVFVIYISLTIIARS